MYKLAIFLLFAVLAVASAQYVYNYGAYPSAYRAGVYNPVYRTGAYGGYVNPALRTYGYSSGVYLA